MAVCMTCQGKGMVLCPHCQGSKKREHPAGYGEVRCHDCDTEGLYPCQKCDETGEVD